MMCIVGWLVLDTAEQINGTLITLADLDHVLVQY